jgi:hypothetical protein
MNTEHDYYESHTADRAIDAVPRDVDVQHAEETL